ncbi:MAG: hypothetical protein QOD63_463 [Actinomycetota bacterium]|nr:hypothetical protein [Actinomycetota bacterium]
MRISRFGLALDAPSGWAARIRRHRPAVGPATTAHDLSPSDARPLGVHRTTDDATGGRPELRVHPVLHAADFALPEKRGDFGSGAVETMRSDQAFIALVEYHRDSARTALFAAHSGMPRQMGTDDFSPRQLQRTIRGQGGTQVFFVEAGRAFCLYVVLGSMANRHQVVPRVNVALSAIEIESPLPPESVDVV